MKKKLKEDSRPSGKKDSKESISLDANKKKRLTVTTKPGSAIGGP
jgi:hypothetical protein